jgi:hypothetical protein
MIGEMSMCCEAAAARADGSIEKLGSARCLDVTLKTAKMGRSGGDVL